MSAAQRICLECGAAFVPRHHSQTVCSDECRRLRDNRLCKESRIRCAEKKRKADADARNGRFITEADFSAICREQGIAEGDVAHFTDFFDLLLVEPVIWGGEHGYMVYV